MGLTKSYSANVGHQKRDSWQRSHSTPVGGRFEPRGQPAISSATKKKLELLRFRPKDTEASKVEPDESDKDNHADLGLAQPEKRPNAPNSSKPRVPDKTPVTKQGSWEQGEHGDGEDDEVSPSERIMWIPPSNARDTIYHNMSDLVRHKRGKKRARSSSPTSSPSDKTAASPAVNIQKLSQALKSPHTDPTLELWDRYTTTTRDSTQHIESAGKFSDMMLISSSPKPASSGTPRKADAGLRRTIPSSRLNFKRRRIEIDDGSPLGSGAGSSSKYSLVTSLLDSVASMQESPLRMVECASQAVENHEASQGNLDESPSPPKRSRPSLHHVPRMAALKPEAASNVAAARPSAGVAPGQEIVTDQQKPVQKTGSDYGDDDFDDAMMIEIETRIAQSQAVSCEPTQTQRKDKVPVVGTGIVANPISIYSSVGGIRSKEFGDGDEEFWEAAVAEIKGRAASAGKPSQEPNHQSGQGTDCNAKSDYGLEDWDDIDDNALIELVAPVGNTSSIENESLMRDMGGNEEVRELHDTTLLDDDDDIDWDAVEKGVSQALPMQSSNAPASVRSQKAKRIQRYLITAVLDCEYVDEYNRSQLEKILFVEMDKTKTTRTVHLRGEWYDTEAKTQSYVHIIGDFSRDGRCIVDNDHNIVILHPDQLVSTTVVADSFGCMRRAVLQDRVKATSEPTPALVYGTLLHEIFQEALTAKRWDPLFLTNVIHNVMEKHVEDLYTIKVGLAAAREHLESKMTELRHWAIAFVAPEPRPDAMVQDRNNKKVNMCINKLLDVEEHVWSPMFGLKGNIDATVQVQIRDGVNKQTLTVPFEVKTGKHVSIHHTAQTALYNLLLSDRYDIDVTCGILYYMESSITMRVPTIRRELRHMILQRNRLAASIRGRNIRLPPMAKRQNMCDRCYAQTPCFIYHRLADEGDGETSGMGAKFAQVVKHLSPVHQEFFVRWENLLTLEERESQKLKRELWTMVSADREKQGRCFGDVVIDQILEEASPTRINRYTYVFVKRDPAPGFSFMESELAMGEPIVVSDEQGHFALAVGYVTKLRKHQITVAVDRRLHNARQRQPGFDEVNNQVFGGIMEVKARGAAATEATSAASTEPPQIRYRLDKDEFSNGMAVVRNNLVQVMAHGVFGSQDIRRLVVDLEPPRFKPIPTQYTISSSSLDSLNVDQKRAIEKVMSAQDYALVLGMPGTGKTYTIAHIIRALVSQGKSVLLTSYTHTAVDNILLKLRDDKMGILRLGAPAKVHPDVQDFVTLAGMPMTSFEQIKEAWHGNPIVATTCLGISHPIFHERTFDVCIVDEASQITLPICLGPIRMAKTFVLVGDHNQLPPLVQNEQAREGGLDVSLFKVLSDAYPDSVVNLEHQYRMCEDIMTLSNTLIYDGRLCCGTEALKKRKLDIPNMSALKQRHHDADTISSFSSSSLHSVCTNGPQCWLRRVLDPEARVVFLDTDNLQPRAFEEAKGKRFVNRAEAQLVTQLVDSLVLTGVPASEIGVMTHYRSQLSLIRHSLRHVGGGVEMHTADRFQGRDKEVVVLSLVRSNEQGSIGDLLKDWRRINVAFTRAKTKLLVVGSRSTLRCAEREMVARFVGIMESRGWVYRLPPDALGNHFFEAATQNVLSPDKSSPLVRRNPMKPMASIAPIKLPRVANSKEKRLLGDMEEFATVRSSQNENARPAMAGVKRAGMGERLTLKNRPITRDVLNDITDGRFSY